MDRLGRYDAAIIGAGQAGVPLARALAGAGWTTALIEREHVGGTCVNEGCTPTKTMIASARVAHLARRAAGYGVSTGMVSVDMPAVRSRKRDIVESWRSGSEGRLRRTENLDLIQAEAGFVGPHILQLRPSGITIEAERGFVNTGCRPALPPIPGLGDVPYLTSTTIMELDAVPEHLIVLGGGYVAAEFAQMFRRFGSEVTVIQRSARLLTREDHDVADAVGAILEEEGIRLVLGATVSSLASGLDDSERGVAAEAGAAGIRVELVTGAGSEVVRGSHLLVATGRTPNTEALDLAAAGLSPDGRGYLPVNETLETAVPGIYALGDVNGGPAFTHISYDDFRVMRTNLLQGGAATVAGRLPLFVVYTDPQLGRVGLTESEAREQGREVQVATMPMAHVARALEIDATRGFIKAVVDVETGLILGCAVLGVEGGELMSVIQMAMLGGLTATRLRDTVFAHPTLAEALNNLFAGV